MRPCGICGDAYLAGTYSAHRQTRGHLVAVLAAHAHPVGDCVEWQGPSRGHGYGHVGRHGSAHRLAYRLFVGEIPAGLEIDHLCRNRACIKPAHLEAVTHLENMRRGWQARKAA